MCRTLKNLGQTLKKREKGILRYQPLNKVKNKEIHKKRNREKGRNFKKECPIFTKFEANERLKLGLFLNTKISFYIGKKKMTLVPP